MASLGVWCSSPCPQWRTAVLWSSGVNIPSRAHAWTDPVEGEFSYLSRFRLGETLWSQSLINKHILVDHSKAQRVFGKYKLWTRSCIFFFYSRTFWIERLLNCWYSSMTGWWCECQPDSCVWGICSQYSWLPATSYRGGYHHPTPAKTSPVWTWNTGQCWGELTAFWYYIYLCSV